MRDMFGTIGTVLNGKATIIFDGETEASKKYYSVLSSYTPVSGDKVLIRETPTSAIVLGKIS